MLKKVMATVAGLAVAGSVFLGFSYVSYVATNEAADRVIAHIDAKNQINEQELLRLLMPLLKTEHGPTPEVIISQGPFDGIKTVRTERAGTLYITDDGRHLIQGRIIQLDSEQMQGPRPDSAEHERQQAMDREAGMAMIQKLQGAEWITLPAAEAKAHVYVFTDPECSYCQKLHGEMDAINAQGIEVRYLAYPRQGVHSPAGQQLSKAWCAKDQAAAISATFKGQALDNEAGCDAVVERHRRYGDEMGVSGTPTIVLQDGTVIRGYVPADVLASQVFKR